MLVSPLSPLILKTEANPDGYPIEIFNQIGADVIMDRSQLYRDLCAPFYGANRPGSQVSQSTQDMFWLWAMQPGNVCVLTLIRCKATLPGFTVLSLPLHDEIRMVLHLGLDLYAR